jgi:hypothetical protein
VSKTLTDPKKLSENYRKSPFILQAAAAGDIYCFQTLIAAGCKLNDVGFVCLSKKKRNFVVSNVVGAACFYGSHEIVRKQLESKLN